MADPEDWIDPLHGYAYDSFNPDALQLASVKNGRIELPGGGSYDLLVVPLPNKLSPNKMTAQTIARIDNLEKSGAKIIRGPYTKNVFSIDRDFQPSPGIAWTHRRGEGFDIYFVSNQTASESIVNLSLRVSGKAPELWDPVSGEISRVVNWTVKNGRTELPVKLSSFGSVFVVFSQNASPPAQPRGINWLSLMTTDTLKNAWTVKFDSSYGGPAQPVVFNTLQDWSKHPDSAIRYYSGTAVYAQHFNYKKTNKKAWLDVGEVNNLATVFVNGVNCGVAWTAPYRVEITAALHDGDNELRIEVTNTWANRLIGDQLLPEAKRITWTTAPFRLKGKPLLKAGLMGPVTLKTEY